MEKKELRQRLLAQRAALPDGACRLEDAAILRRVLALPEYQRAQTVFLYVSTPQEVDTRRLIRLALQEGKRVVVPRCVLGSVGLMELCALQDLAQLTPGTMGILEPVAGCETLRPTAVDFALVPCVSCDEGCNRLGYGGGYYDRVLRLGHFFTAAVCREALVQQSLPTESWDLPVDMVITGTREIRSQPNKRW